MAASTEERRNEIAEVAVSLERRAVELWGEERTAAIQGAIADAARAIWLVESDPAPADEEPAQYPQRITCKPCPR